jgi:hypothetical protein
MGKLNQEERKMGVLRTLHHHPQEMTAIHAKLLTVLRQRHDIAPRTNSAMLHMSGWAGVHMH